MKYPKTFLKRFTLRFVKWFDLNFSWFFTNGNKNPKYLEKYH